MSSIGSTVAGSAGAGDLGGVGERQPPGGRGAHVQAAAVVDAELAQVDRDAVDGDRQGLRGEPGPSATATDQTSSASRVTSSSTSAGDGAAGGTGGLWLVMSSSLTG